MAKHSLADVIAASRDRDLTDRMIAAAAELGHPFPAAQIADAAARVVAVPVADTGDSIASVYAYAANTYTVPLPPGANPAAVLDSHIREAVAQVLGQPGAPA